MVCKRGKVLFIDHTPFMGGAQIFLMQLIKSLNHDKYTISIACSEISVELKIAEKYEKMGIECKILPMDRIKILNPIIFLRLFVSVKSIVQELKNEKIDLLFCSTVRTCILGGIASIFTRVRLVWYIQDCTFLKLFFKILGWIPVKILFVSQAVKDFYGYEKEKGLVVHNGSDYYEMIKKYDYNDKILLKSELGIKQGDFVVGFIGRIVREKGVHVLLRSIHELLEEGYDISCVVLGSGKGQNGNNEIEIKRWVKDKKIANKVIFTGFRSDSYRYMNIFDIFCFVSLEFDAFPLSIIEAMLSEKAVIATNVGGVSEIINDGINGILVQPENINDLKKSIMKLYQNSSLKNEIAVRARKEANEKYSINVVSKNINKLIEEIIYG